jgi:peptidoglycan/LPS O-acetylase OafA/YrhL
MKTLHYYAASRENSFDFIRFFSALGLIFSNAFDLVLQQNPLPAFLRPFEWGAHPGLLCFFTISGFLVTGSFLRYGPMFDFLHTRVLRIVPAFMASMVLCILVGLWVTTLTVREYITDSQTQTFIYRHLLLYTGDLTLPGVFLNNPGAQLVNGVLWTAPVLCGLYAILFSMGWVGVIQYRIAAVVGWTALGVFCTFAIPVPGPILSLMYSFMIGSVLYLFKDYILLSWGILWFFFYSAKLLKSTGFLYEPILLFILAYAMLCVAYLLPNLGQFITRHGNFSYGLYLFGFPVTQVVIYWMPTIGGWMLFCLAACMTLCFAAMSWYWLEKPALRFKRYQPRPIFVGKM